MIRIELTSHDAALLREVLESYLSDLQTEIAATDAAEFRQRLKERQQLLDRLVSELEQRA